MAASDVFQPGSNNGGVDNTELFKEKMLAGVITNTFAASTFEQGSRVKTVTLNKNDQFYQYHVGDIKAIYNPPGVTVPAQNMKQSENKIGTDTPLAARIVHSVHINNLSEIADTQINRIGESYGAFRARLFDTICFGVLGQASEAPSPVDGNRGGKVFTAEVDVMTAADGPAQFEKLMQEAVVYARKHNMPLGSLTMYVGPEVFRKLLLPNKDLRDTQIGGVGSVITGDNLGYKYMGIPIVFAPYLTNANLTDGPTIIANGLSDVNGAAILLSKYRYNFTKTLAFLATNTSLVKVVNQPLTVEQDKTIADLTEMVVVSESFGVGFVDPASVIQLKNL